MTWDNQGRTKWVSQMGAGLTLAPYFLLEAHMTIFDGIMAGLEDALAYKRGEPNGVVVRVRSNDTMGYRRLFIMRKDLGMSPGKLAAQVGHCTEAYWTRLLRSNALHEGGEYKVSFNISADIFEQYINGAFVKTICEARNKNHLLKAKTKAEDLGLVENEDYGLIYDNCRTELEPEEENGTTLTGIWFRPLPDDIAHEISKKYHLYV